MENNQTRDRPALAELGAELGITGAMTPDQIVHASGAAITLIEQRADCLRHGTLSRAEANRRARLYRLVEKRLGAN